MAKEKPKKIISIIHYFEPYNSFNGGLQYSVTRLKAFRCDYCDKGLDIYFQEDIKIETKKKMKTKIITRNIFLPFNVVYKVECLDFEKP